MQCHEASRRSLIDFMHMPKHRRVISSSVRHVIDGAPEEQR